jgi:hypothetical protein
MLMKTILLEVDHLLIEHKFLETGGHLMHREGERVEHRVRRARIARHHLAQLGHLAPALLEERVADAPPLT